MRTTVVAVPGKKEWNVHVVLFDGAHPMPDQVVAALVWVEREDGVGWTFRLYRGPDRTPPDIALANAMIATANELLPRVSS